MLCKAVSRKMYKKVYIYMYMDPLVPVVIKHVGSFAATTHLFDVFLKVSSK